MRGQFGPSGELGFGIPDRDAGKGKGRRKCAPCCTRKAHGDETRGPSPGREIVGAAGVRTPWAPLTFTEQLCGTGVEILYVFHTKRKTTAPSSSCWPLKIGETLLLSYFLSLPRLVHQPQPDSLLPQHHTTILPPPTPVLSLLFCWFYLVCSLSPQGKGALLLLVPDLSASPLNLGGKVTRPLS